MDFALQQWINHDAGTVPLVDNLMRLAAGAEYVLIAVVAAWLLFGVVSGRLPDEVGATLATAASGLALLVNTVVGYLWFRPRPFVDHPGSVHVLLGHPADASFPSDHAAAGFAVAAILVMTHRRLGALLLLGSALISYARVYVGDEYPGDIAGGVVVGVASALLVTAIGRGTVRRAWARLPSEWRRARESEG